MATYSAQAARNDRMGHPSGFNLAEGWGVLLPHIAALALTAYSITKIGSGERASVLVPMTVAGLLVGLVLAKLPILDAFAHLVALTIGSISVLTVATAHEIGWRTILRDHGRPVALLGRDIVDRFSHGSGTKLPDSELLVLISLTLWLVGYSSSWMLYRREWLMPALVLPGTMLMVTMRYDRQPPAAPVAGFLFCAILMSARHHAFREAKDWGRRRLTFPGGVATRLVIGGAVIGALSLLLAWGTTFESSSRLREQASTQGQQAWQKIQDMLGKAGLPGGTSGSGAGSYSTFPSSFELGGNLDLSDTIVADVSSNAPHYLTVRSYDLYNGSGWETTVDDTFKLPGDKSNVHAIPISFGPRQSVPFSSAIASNQVASEASVHVLANKDGLVFTIESFDSSTMPTMALMGWVKLDHVRIDVARIDASTLPPDLQGLVRYLQQASFAPSSDGGEPFIVQNSISSSVAAERDRLKGFPVETSLSLDSDGSPILTVSGRLPNYDDIEAVYQSISTNGSQVYRVAGVQSTATKAQLEATGVSYPAWVTQRYLQQSSTITSRTKALAHQIVAQAGATNPFDEAWAIQQYLTGSNFTYQLNSPGPPNGQDFVDYFLFDSKVGRCEQYASSMVVLLRELGIPSRLVSGYRVGEQNSDGQWVYRENQAHTWVEVYFEGQGWIPFEPTKGQDPFAYGKTQTTEQTPTADIGAATPEATQVAEPTQTPEPTAVATPIAAAVTDNQSGHWWDGLSPLTLALLACAALIVAAIGFTMIAWGWGLRGMTPTASLYARMLRLGRFAGVRADPALTPGEYAQEFRSAAPMAGTAVKVIADLYVAERYGHAAMGQEEAARGRRAWRHMRRNAVFLRSKWARRLSRRRSNSR